MATYFCKILYFSSKLMKDIYSLTHKNASLASYSTFGIGGEAELLLEVNSKAQLRNAIQWVYYNDCPVTILGGGSNVLISDRGIKGLVIINKSKNFSIQHTGSLKNNFDVQPRHDIFDQDYYSYSDLQYRDSGGTQEITFDSGVSMIDAIRISHDNRLTGLCHFAGIPGTIGGGLYNNLHGANKHLSDYFVSADIIELSGSKLLNKVVGSDYFDFGYDKSKLRFKNTDFKIIVLDVTLNLFLGDVLQAQVFAKEWLRRKKIQQPWNSAGCVFQNLTVEQQSLIDSPSSSWGYVADKILDLKYLGVGGAEVSPLHASFIVNHTGLATSRNVLDLMIIIKTLFYDKLGIVLEPEINFLGFEDEELSPLLI
jgi:UDP-N-acetylmuramate dehydrogenase